MKINLAKSAGFCFGVKRAIAMANAAARDCTEVVMLGDIVHNEDVVKKIEKAGIKKINKLREGEGKTLLVRAHGATQKTITAAKRLRYAVLDATCPMVKEIHEIAKKHERKSYTVIVIGDKNHDEVNGIVGQLKQKAIVIDFIKNIPYQKIKKIKKACVVSQSTQNIDKVLTIAEELKRYIPEIKFFNTICQPTRTKQKEIRCLPLNNDAMVIIGSRTSANTRRLYEISKSLNKNSYYVESEKELKARWFKKTKSTGITAGASTPDEATQRVIKRIRTIAKAL